MVAAGKFETGEPAAGAEGDWNNAPNAPFTYETGPPPGDGFFNSVDIIAALAAQHFEQGPVRAALQAEGVKNIPEPSTISLLIAGWLILFLSRTRQLRGRTCGTVGLLFEGRLESVNGANRLSRLQPF